MLSFTPLENPREGVLAEYAIESDVAEGAGFTIALASMGLDSYAPETRFFDDAIPTLSEFIFVGGAKALSWEGKEEMGFTAALTAVGIPHA